MVLLQLVNVLQDIGEPCIHLRIHKTDPVSKQTTPITFSMSGDKFRLLLRGKNFCASYNNNISPLCMTFMTLYAFRHETSSHHDGELKLGGIYTGTPLTLCHFLKSCI